MFIHYSHDGDYESCSNTQMKSVRSFIRTRDLAEIMCGHHKLNGISDFDFPLFCDVMSLNNPVNMDCVNCKLETCDSMYPIELILEIGGKFEIIRGILFVSCEDTRLISMYGKRGHLKHCVDSHLNDNPYYNGELKHTGEFPAKGYKPAFKTCGDTIRALFSDDTYNQIVRKCVKRTTGLFSF